MHRVVPELIIENYRAGRYRGEFPAVGMFLDLSGFSTMTDVLMQHGQHGAEVLANLMHGVFDPLVENIFNHGGKIVGFAGDGIMALYPIENDALSTALSALTSAWLIQRWLAEGSQRLTIYGTFQFTARIGLTLGNVSWGILHSEDKQSATYFFRGTAVEECAQAEQHARVGQILITENLNALVSTSIHATPFSSYFQLTALEAAPPAIRPAVFPPVDFELSRIFMPDEVIAENARGEFRQVVNLFMRFPDISNEKLSEVTQVIFNLRSQYGGLLNRVDFGDKGCNILMLWGAPVAYENDIGRALNFILDLQSRVDIPVTAGVTYYIAHAGYLGSVMCEDYTCYGWGVNLASRFMMSAPTGEIWVDDRITRRVSNRFVIDYIGSQQFKGFAAEQRVHRLKSYIQNAESTYQGEMIGRERELSQLEKFIDPVWRGDFAGALLILGDAGIGKGRLIHGFRTSKLFEGRKALWALCQSEQILRQSFNPFRSWLFHYFGFTAAQSMEARRNVFESRLNDLMDACAGSEPARELDRLRSVLGALVDLSWRDSLYEQLDAEARYNSTLLALLALIKAESLRQPVILFVEDVQFIDDDSLQFLPRLKRSLLAGGESYPVAIIATSRIESQSPMFDGNFVDDQMVLRGLPREAVARLVEILLGGVPSLSLVNLVMDRSEGNAYFIEHIIRYFQEENLIEMSADGWKQVKGIQSSFLPGDIGALLVARLDQLSRKVRETIQTASVFGREFLIDVLAEMTAEGDAIEQYVLAAEQAAIWSGEQDGYYIFTHGLLRDAAYSMQMRARRQELHALALEALESIYRDNLKFHYAELAHHAERADIREKTRLYYTLAGKSASEAYQNARGVDYFSRALSFTPIGDIAAQFDLRVERAELFRRMGDLKSQLKDLDELVKLAQQLNDLGREALVEMLFAHYYIVSSDYPAVIQHAERVIALSGASEDADVVLRTYQVWPLALMRMGKLEDALKIAIAGRNLARQYGNVVREGYILISMGLVAFEQKNPAMADEYFQTALTIAYQTKDKRLESRALGNLGNTVGFVFQDYVLAREYYTRAYELYRQFGEQTPQTTMLANLGWISGMLGDFDNAFSYYLRALLISREMGNLYSEAFVLLNLSSVSGIRNVPQDAIEYGQKAVELSRKTADRGGEAWALHYMGYAYLLLADWTKAEEAFRRSILIRAEMGQLALTTESQAGLIQLYLKKGDYDLALAEVENVIPFLEDSDSLRGTEEPLRVYFACHQALEKIQDPRSSTVLQAAVQLLETQVSKLRDDQIRKMFIENVPWRLAIWQARNRFES